jgi:simple sugar transport system ATP-binding protein
VLENVVLGDEPRKGLQIDDEAAADRIRALAASVGSTIDPYESVGDLGVGERQRVEILKVLYRGANVLILDEPTAVLVPQEVDDLFRNLRRLVDAGATVIFISHKLDEVLAYADAITVIRAGTTVADVLPSQVNRRSLGELMVGSELPEPSGRTTAIGETVLLRATGLRATTDGGKAALADVSLSIRSGEILGIAGVEGNGQSELCEAILGLMPVESGQVEIDGVDVSNLETSQRKLRGIGYIPFDRQREGLLMAAPLWENLLLGRDEQPSYRWGPFLRNRRVVAACRTTIERFGVKTPSASTPAFALSGGNQQKLIVGREMGFRPRVLLAAHPTRGVDIGAQAAIWDEIKAARDDGLAILLVSADLDELIGLSDRIAVMFDGAITAELDPGTATPQLLGEYMTGAVAA